MRWTKLALGFCKFNIDGVARGKHGRAGIGGVIHDDRGRILLAFSEPIGLMESNEAELLAIRRPLQIWSRFGTGNLIIECDSTNGIAWASNMNDPLTETGKHC